MHPTANPVSTKRVGRSGADDIQTVVEKLHVPHASKSGVNVVITDLEPKVIMCMQHCHRTEGDATQSLHH